MKIISFEASLADRKLIARCAKRAVKMAKEAGVDYDFQSADMDLTACHANGMPMDFKKLLTADDFNFGHDAFGIRRHIDRTTGELKDCFVPRCSKH